MPLKRQSQQNLTAFVVCWNVLQAFPTNSIDSDQGSDLGSHCLSLYLIFLTLKAPITTEADDKFCDIFPNFQKK